MVLFLVQIGETLNDAISKGKAVLATDSSQEDDDEIVERESNAALIASSVLARHLQLSPSKVILLQFLHVLYWLILPKVYVVYVRNKKLKEYLMVQFSCVYMPDQALAEVLEQHKNRKSTQTSRLFLVMNVCPHPSSPLSCDRKKALSKRFPFLGSVQRQPLEKKGSAKKWTVLQMLQLVCVS